MSQTSSAFADALEGLKAMINERAKHLLKQYLHTCSCEQQKNHKIHNLGVALLGDFLYTTSLCV